MKKEEVLKRFEDLVDSGAETVVVAITGNQLDGRLAFIVAPIKSVNAKMIEEIGAVGVLPDENSFYSNSVEWLKADEQLSKENEG